MGAIYRLYCRPTQKYYVGQTTKASWRDRYAIVESEIRYLRKTGKASRPIEYALCKYGWEAFEARDLMTNVPEEDLDALERFFIRTFRANERGFGYNVESGGNRSKRISEDGIRRFRVAHSRFIVTWEHRQHGRHRCTAIELTRRFSGLQAASLSKVRRGIYRQHRGWVSESPSGRFFDKKRVYRWQNEDGRKFVGSTGQLVRSFPEEALSRQELAYVAQWRVSQSGTAPRHAHRGWKCCGYASPEESRECSKRADW
jgi:hypothetical protein